MLVGIKLPTFAQDDIILYIADQPESLELCLDHNQRVIIYAQSGCEEFSWVSGSFGTIWNESPLIINPGNGSYYIDYYGCNGFHHDFGIAYEENPVPNSFTHNMWKRFEETDMLEVVGSDSTDYPFWYNFLWSTGETTRTIEITEPGNYTCEISGLCGTATRTFIVRDNVELYRATVDLATNLNKPTWQTTAEQAEYISEVKVERDGMVVGTVPYGQGCFLDNIGSENAARNYRLTGIDTDGNECPIPSYQKGTLHVDYSPNASNPNKLNMAWTPPFIEEGAPLTVSYFQICKYNPNTGEVTVVDQLGANNTIGSYDIDLFEGGHAVVAALFSEGKDYEEVSFSNMTEDVLGVEENAESHFEVYPNPTNGIITVETVHAPSLQGQTEYRITNVMGQTLLRGTMEAEKQQIDIQCLLQGVYFISMGGETRKIVVE